MKYRVYKYTFPNGKIYIGCTHLKIEQRRDNGYQHNKRLQSAMREYGWANVQVDIIGDDLEKKEAFDLEKQTIESLHSTDENIGYNISFGGTSTFSGLKHTEAHKKHMSELYKGRTFSEETMKRMIQAHAKECKKVIGIDADGNVTEYRSLCDAAKSVGTSATTISRVCRRKGTYKNIKWQFAE